MGGRAEKADSFWHLCEHLYRWSLTRRYFMVQVPNEYTIVCVYRFESIEKDERVVVVVSVRIISFVDVARDAL